MIQLSFMTLNRKLIRFAIDRKVVKYFDDNWKDGLQIYPMDRLMVKKMVVSRKHSISAMGLLIADANMGKNLEEYNKCDTEEEIAELIRIDCKMKGLREVEDGKHD